MKSTSLLAKPMGKVRSPSTTAGTVGLKGTEVKNPILERKTEGQIRFKS